MVPKYHWPGRLFLIGLGLLAQAACSSRWVSLGEGISLDTLSIHEDNRLPAVDRDGKPLTGTVYAATLRLTRSPDLVPYSPDDPEAKKYMTVWDDQSAEYFFHCDSPVLMSIDPGQVHNSLRGKPMLSYRGDEGARRHVMFDYAALMGEGSVFPAAALKAGEIVCSHARKMSQ